MTDGDEPDQTGRSEVQTTFDRIADEFDTTRYAPWPEVTRFVERFGEGARIGIDIGCGNGRHANLLTPRGIDVIGVDLSRPLLQIAADRVSRTSGAFHPVQGDAVAPPVGTDVVDLGIYVATIHHIRDRSDRRRSLDELARVLVPGCPAIVSAWSVEADRFESTSGFDTTIEWVLDGGERVDRFYHIYDPEEFDRDLVASQLVTAERFESSGNCYAIVQASE